MTRIGVMQYIEDALQQYSVFNGITVLISFVMKFQPRII